MFEEIFTPPPKENISMETVQDDICAAEVDFTVLAEEIMDSLAGLSNFLDAASELVGYNSALFLNYFA